MTDTPEVTPVRSSSPELSAMTLPKLKEVATQLGIDGAAKLKKDALVTAIADLQAANREAAKAEREARREARNAKKRGNKDNSSNSNANSDEDGDDEGDDNSSSSSSDSNSNSNLPDLCSTHGKLLIVLISPDAEINLQFFSIKLFVSHLNLLITVLNIVTVDSLLTMSNVNVCLPDSTSTENFLSKGILGLDNSVPKFISRWSK